MSGTEDLQIKIIQEPSKDNPFIVIYKPSGLPSAPLKDGEQNNAVFQATRLFPQIRTVSGKKKCEYGLLHRIDTDTRGLLVIAASQNAYETLLQEQKQQKFIKTYKALCRNKADTPVVLDAFPPQQGFYQDLLKNRCITVTSAFRPFGLKNAQVRPVTGFSGKSALKKSGKKLYTTKITLLKNASAEKIIPVECEIAEGYRHQIRAHLAWIGFPIAGDPLYDPSEETVLFNFEAFKISFFHPVTGKKITFTV